VSVDLEQVETMALIEEIEARLARIGIALERREWWRPFLEAVVDIYDVEEAELVGRKRTATVARGRGIAMWLMRKHTRRTLAEIGGVFGRDHGTVLHWCHRVVNAQRVDPPLWSEMQACERRLITRSERAVEAALRRRVKCERGLPEALMTTPT
jgi:chromosomal replication initiation ATPase DnaA